MAVPAVFANQKADGTTLAGSIRWGDFKIQYLGTTYTIPAGSTTLRWMWWRYNGGGANSYIEAGADIPVDLADDDIVILGNKSGVPFRIQSTQLLDGDLIVDGSIAGAAIAAGTISADKMDVKIATIEDLTTGFIMSGRIQVGQSFWSLAEGIVIPQPGGGTITLPADGVTPARVTAHFVAKSMTVEDNLNVNGTNNKLSGQLALANGVTRPTIPPSLSQTYPSVPSTDTTYLGPISYGATSHHSDSSLVVYANAFFGGGVGAFNKTTGERVLIGGDLSSWATDFNPTGGIVRIGSAYYVVGYDTKRNGNWYIYQLGLDFLKVGEQLVLTGSDANNYGRLSVGSDASGNLLVAIPADTGVIINRYGTPALTQASIAGGRPAQMSLSLPNLNRAPLSYIGEGAFDFGVSSILVGVEGNAVFYFTAANVRDDTYRFLAAGGGRIRGMLYIDGAFKAHDTDGRFTTYSANRSSTSITGSYTWYDGVGVTRETQASPPTTFQLLARAWPTFEAPPPPDNGVAGSGVDRANRIGVYLATGTAARRLQIYLPVDSQTFVATRQYTAASITATGSTEPSTNGFLGATTGSPGSVVSADGASGVYGDGQVFAAQVPSAPTHAANKLYVDSRGAAGNVAVPALAVNASTNITITLPAGRFLTAPTPGGFLLSASSIRNSVGLVSMSTTQMVVTVINLTGAASAAGTLYWSVIATS